jgi:hypothetical protein
MSQTARRTTAPHSSNAALLQQTLRNREGILGIPASHGITALARFVQATQILGFAEASSVLLNGTPSASDPLSIVEHIAYRLAPAPLEHHHSICFLKAVQEAIIENAGLNEDGCRVTPDLRFGNNGAEVLELFLIQYTFHCIWNAVELQVCSDAVSIRSFEFWLAETGELARRSVKRVALREFGEDIVARMALDQRFAGHILTLIEREVHELAR